MEDFLTTRQVLDILKVDRITIYRMLNDGRLKGTKIGHQWRFTRADVESLLKGEKLIGVNGKTTEETGLPVHCLQAIQDLFASVSQYSAVLISPQGELITEISKPCQLCQVFQANPAAAEACLSSYGSFARQVTNGLNRFICHAGLNYVGTLINVGDEQIGLFLAGGYFLAVDNSEEKAAFLEKLGSRLGISGNQLTTAYHQIPILQTGQQIQLETWSIAAATAFESILREQLGFAHRLKKIADLTQIS
ncbi:MAG: PocR ligand-binding domain-containing protein [Leptolinea sp.]